MLHCNNKNHSGDNSFNIKGHLSQNWKNTAMKLRQELHGGPVSVRNKLETDADKIKNTVERQKKIDVLPSANKISSHLYNSKISKEELIMNGIDLA